ncbi:radical SAM protein [Candidatus Woesearchaeota archaeon]|nr:radical SAM protein [Candidatus Woesearchaeota archaeon]
MDVILDCYTDEPSGLGVPPYLGTYPRYIAGYLGKAHYLTIDDLRFFRHYKLDEKKKEVNRKTNIRVSNLTGNIGRISSILENASSLIIILGVHTPGKYLSALPGTLNEVCRLISGIRCEKILTGPAVFGTQSCGGRFFERAGLKAFDRVEPFDFKYDEIRDYSVDGAYIVSQIPALRIIEIETGHGCSREKGCSFCMEPLKHPLEFRKKEDIIREIGSFYKLGCRHFRLGKQSDIYLYPPLAGLLRGIRKQFPEIEALHIDNVNPKSVISGKGAETTKDIVKYCTEGNVAAFGVESFDPEVCRENNLNCRPEEAYEAVRLLNRYGSERGINGMPKLLPGINLLYGLKGESKSTHHENMLWLKRILEEKLMLRRINIRQVSIFEGTDLYNGCGNRFLKKNKKYYWKWRDEIRHKIDLPMLKRLVPEETLLKGCMAEVYDGNTTFCRQIGTYPLIVGVKERLDLGKFYGLRVKGHMLRSVVGAVEKD